MLSNKDWAEEIALSWGHDTWRREHGMENADELVVRMINERTKAKDTRIAELEAALMGVLGYAQDGLMAEMAFASEYHTFASKIVALQRARDALAKGKK